MMQGSFGIITECRMCPNEGWQQVVGRCRVCITHLHRYIICPGFYAFQVVIPSKVSRHLHMGGREVGLRAVSQS